MAVASENTKKRAFRMLERRDYARGELIDRLVKKGESLEDAEAAADRLCELGLINDENYAGIVARHYARKGFGAARIKQELYRRFVPRELWDEALSELPEADSVVDALLRTKLRTDDPGPAELKTAADALRRRGYSWDEIKSSIERFDVERNANL
ncbi:MAG TPA: RecX family transcriptional regulator [Clostridiales bacterium]|nr:RecX family transcriptional regulator [Clostridiales bacterium]